MDGRRGSRERTGARGTFALGVLAIGLLVARDAAATFRYGDIQISGNVQTQNLFRLQDGTNTFEAFNPVQQRNTSGCSTSTRWSTTEP